MCSEAVVWLVLIISAFGLLGFVFWLGMRDT